MKMKNIKVLGTGCANCKATLKLIEQAATAAGIDIELEKIEDMPKIMSYGIMSTPGVVINGQVVHSGGIPTKENINLWLQGDTSSCSSEKSSGGCC